MSEILLLQPPKADIPSRGICATVPAGTPLPGFTLFQEVRTAPNITAIVVGLEWMSLDRSEVIYEDSSYEGWWVHIDWRFDPESEIDSRVADTLGHTWPEELLEDAAESYQRSQQTQAVQPVELLPVASLGRLDHVL